MHPDPNDPRLTALALGEVDELDEAERAEIEQHLAGCPACRQEVDRLRELGLVLSQELGKEPLPAADVRPIRLPGKRRRTTVRRAMAIAACALVAGGVGLIIAYERASRVQGLADSGGLWKKDHFSKSAKFETKTSSEPRSPMRANNSRQENLNRLAPHPDDPQDLPSLRDSQQNLRQSIKKSPVYPVADLVIPIKNQPVPQTPASVEVQAILTTGSTSVPGAVASDSLGGIGGGMAGMGGGMAGPAPSDAGWERLTMSRAKLRPVDVGPPRQPERESNTEAYDRIVDNPFLDAIKNPLSTFSIDVDTASYSNVRRFLMEGNSLPPKDAVRIEELVNYFSYDYAPPKDDAPFAAHIEAADCPWQPEHRLVRIGLKGRVIADNERPASNLVFLLDVSGSMEPANKLPLVRQAMSMLVRKLGDKDRVAIVVYQGASGLVLPSTSCEEKVTILAALDNLMAGGSTNGGEGIQLAYQVARQNLVRGGTNRVILCTDGDFNVGITNQGDLTRLIEKEAAGGVFLTVLGFGMGNLKDSTLEELADKGNGNYGYIDSPAEARKLLVDQLGGTLVTIAKDVKIQVEFNPARAGSYRLIGYENRMLRKEDFNDDKKDAGEIGAGHTVTALYEVVPPGQPSGAGSVASLKYQQPPKPAADASGELLTLKLRYKQPEGETSKLIEIPFTDAGVKWAASSRDFRFAAAVAAFGMILRDSPYKGHATIDAAHEWAVEGKGDDRAGYRRDFFPLLDRAKTLLTK